jgi:hypothetical protein
MFTGYPMRRGIYLVFTVPPSQIQRARDFKAFWNPERKRWLKYWTMEDIHDGAIHSAGFVVTDIQILSQDYF